MTAAGSGHESPGGLADFNARPAEAARQLLLGCCSSACWAGAVLAGRPYSSGASLLRSSDEAVASLAPADLRDALAGHPRIGARAALWPDPVLRHPRGRPLPGPAWASIAGFGG